MATDKLSTADKDKLDDQEFAWRDLAKGGKDRKP
jgi:hypothetical protein